MSANVEGMVREGVSAFKAGRIDEARALLTKAIELDPYNEQGWLWLSGVVSSAEDQRTCLENVLAINPSNSRARSGLDFLIGQSAPPAVDMPPPAPQPAAVQPETAAPESLPAAAPPIFTANPVSVTSVEWGAYEATPEEEDWDSPPPAPASAYDDWVTGLQLGSAESAPAQHHDPFTAVTPSTSPFYDSGDLLEKPDDSPALTTGAGFALPSEEKAPAAPLPIRLPGRPAYGGDDDDAAPAAAYSSSSAYMDEVELGDDEIYDIDDEQEFFAGIPREIKATRLPGTHQRSPLLLKLAVLILIPLNFAAALLLAWRLL